MTGSRIIASFCGNHKSLDQRHLQNIADAAALAAAQQIANDGGATCSPACVGYATSYTQQNGFADAHHGTRAVHRDADPVPLSRPELRREHNLLPVALQRRPRADPREAAHLHAHVLREHGRRRAADLLVGALGGEREVPDPREHDDHAGSDHPAHHHSLNQHADERHRRRQRSTLARDTSCSGGITISSNSQFTFNAGAAYSDGSFKNSRAYTLAQDQPAATTRTARGQ